MPEMYKGIKTGTTEAAGPCLASLLQINNREFIIVVLNSRTLKSRYKDTEKLR
jgi:D-alanyl-D-alanine carboxypeptidase